MIIKKALKKLLTTFSFRLYLLYFLMVGGSAWFIASHSLQALEKSVNQVAEEILIDTANLLAELAEQEIKNGDINVARFEQLIPDYLARRFDANIYKHHKTQADVNIYLTDKTGKVLFDSTGQSLGKDFSNWRDVHATLDGRYGARVSSLNYAIDDVPEIDKGLFVASPIHDNAGNIVGVLTVVKANRHLRNYLILSNKQVIFYALLVLLISLIAGAFITWWLWRSIRKLSRYAKQLGSGESTQQPKIIHNEFKPLANAMQNMYEELAGKEYVENYIHTMAHELKSPLTGIIASTELLQQDLPEQARQNFTNNIHDSATRMSALIERLLRLAALEKRHALDKISDIDVATLLHDLLVERQHQLKQKNLSVKQQLDAHLPLHGEPTLIAQSLANLLDNAIDFSLAGGIIDISATYHADTDLPLTICIRDNGEGIADFAQSRLFERFYSTPRPDTQQRSSGLGLAFVKEAITLHGGTITLDNHPDGGAEAIIRLPKITTE